MLLLICYVFLLPYKIVMKILSVFGWLATIFVWTLIDLFFGKR